MASNPILLIVNDNPDIRAAIERDLRTRYGDQHEIRSAPSGHDALGLLRDAQGRGDPVALVLADQRMPRQTGQDVLVEAHRLAPAAGRLPADAARGLGGGPRGDQRRSDRRLPGQALGTSGATGLSAPGRPDAGLARRRLRHPRRHSVIGSRWSPEVSAMPAIFSPAISCRTAGSTSRPTKVVESPSASRRASHRALVVFPDGSALVEPTNAALAEKAGLRQHAEQRFYDLVTLTGRPARARDRLGGRLRRRRRSRRPRLPGRRRPRRRARRPRRRRGPPHPL